MEEVENYITTNQDRFISELIEFLKIPSVSSNDHYLEDSVKAAFFVKEQLLKAGADISEVRETAKIPIVYAEKIVDINLPTVLIYGHYDVQPAEPLHLWHNPPFEPIIKDNKIYARGACDDKGQMFMHIKSLEFLTQTNQFPCNLKFLFEGEEEIGSPSLEKYLVDHKEELKADIVLVSDTALINNDTPSLIYGLKGIIYFDIELTGAKKELHSGIHGGTVENPLHVLCNMVSKLHDENKQITIPGFYADILEPSDLEKEMMNQIPFDLEEFKSLVGVKEITGEAGYSTLERISFRPTLDVNGIWGGHNGQGAKTVIASKAFAKISMRLVNGQSIEKVISSFESYFRSLAPETIDVQMNVLASCESALTPIDSVAYKAAEKAMFHTFGKKPLPVRMGGSIPVISLFEKVLGINSVLMGFGLDSDNIHGPNEHYGIWNFFKGIETIPFFYKYFVELSLK